VSVRFLAFTPLPSTTHAESRSTEFLDQSTFFPFRCCPEDLAYEFARWGYRCRGSDQCRHRCCRPHSPDDNCLLSNGVDDLPSPEDERAPTDRDYGVESVLNDWFPSAGSRGCTWVLYRREPEKEEEPKQDHHRPPPRPLASAVRGEQAGHPSSGEGPRRVKKPATSMGKLAKTLLVPAAPSPKSLVKLPTTFEHHEQGPDHQDQGQQEHGTRFHIDGKVQRSAATVPRHWRKKKAWGKRGVRCLRLLAVKGLICWSVAMSSGGNRPTARQTSAKSRFWRMWPNPPAVPPSAEQSCQRRNERGRLTFRSTSCTTPPCRSTGAVGIAVSMPAFVKNAGEQRAAPPRRQPARPGLAG